MLLFILSFTFYISGLDTIYSFSPGTFYDVSVEIGPKSYDVKVSAAYDVKEAVNSYDFSLDCRYFQLLGGEPTRGF